MLFADAKVLDDRGMRRVRESFEGWTGFWRHACWADGVPVCVLVDGCARCVGRWHRSGVVSRVLVTNLLETRGKCIDSGVRENVAVRWGGWSVKHGAVTMMHTCCSICIGECDDAHVWAARLDSFTGTVLPLLNVHIADPNPGAQTM